MLPVRAENTNPASLGVTPLTVETARALPRRFPFPASTRHAHHVARMLSASAPWRASRRSLSGRILYPALDTSPGLHTNAPRIQMGALQVCLHIEWDAPVGEWHPFQVQHLSMPCFAPTCSREWCLPRCTRAVQREQAHWHRPQLRHAAPVRASAVRTALFDVAAAEAVGRWPLALEWWQQLGKG